jgi:hypothetical protein
MAIYLFSVKTFVFSSFVVPPLIKREGLDFFVIGVPLLHLIPPEVTLKYCSVAPMVLKITPQHGPHGKRSMHC